MTAALAPHRSFKTAFKIPLLLFTSEVWERPIRSVKLVRWSWHVT
jgi:hypothetical protein